jgi:hypothetical protein
MKGFDPRCRVSPTFVDEIENLPFGASKLMFCFNFFLSCIRNRFGDTHAKFETQIIRLAFHMSYLSLILS